MQKGEKITSEMCKINYKLNLNIKMYDEKHIKEKIKSFTMAAVKKYIVDLKQKP